MTVMVDKMDVDADQAEVDFPLQLVLLDPSIDRRRILWQRRG